VTGAIHATTQRGKGCDEGLQEKSVGGQPERNMTIANSGEIFVRPLYKQRLMGDPVVVTLLCWGYGQLRLAIGRRTIQG
jgi:hypothetical protein